MLPESGLLLQNITCDVEEVNADYVNEAIVRNPQFLTHAKKWGIERCAMPAITLLPNSTRHADGPFHQNCCSFTVS